MLEGSREYIYIYISHHTTTEKRSGLTKRGWRGKEGSPSFGNAFPAIGSFFRVSGISGVE
jgi:hypothetical protein